jgi:hypothetical protein
MGRGKMNVAVYVGFATDGRSEDRERYYKGLIGEKSGWNFVGYYEAFSALAEKCETRRGIDVVLAEFTPWFRQPPALFSEQLKYLSWWYHVMVIRRVDGHLPFDLYEWSASMCEATQRLSEAGAASAEHGKGDELA